MNNNHYPLVEVNYIQPEVAAILESADDFTSLVITTCCFDMTLPCGSIVSPWNDYTKYMWNDPDLPRPTMKPEFFVELFERKVDVNFDARPLIGFVNYLGLFVWPNLGGDTITGLRKLLDLYGKATKINEIRDIFNNHNVFYDLQFTSPIIYIDYHYDYLH